MDVFVKVPKDVELEFGTLAKEDWQVLFSRFVKEKRDVIREINSIASKSKASEEQVEELSRKARLSIAKRFLKE